MCAFNIVQAFLFNVKEVVPNTAQSRMNIENVHYIFVIRGVWTKKDLNMHSCGSSNAVQWWICYVERESKL